MTAPKLAACLEKPVRGIGIKLTKIQSSKFCTGRHLQYYNETIDLLNQIEEKEEGGEPKKKKRKLEKPFSGSTQQLAECREESRILNKISKILPDIVEKTKVLSLSLPPARTNNILNMECEPRNQLKLIETVITAITGLDTGDHIILEGFPLFTRLFLICPWGILTVHQVFRIIILGRISTDYQTI